VLRVRLCNIVNFFHVFFTFFHVFMAANKVILYIEFFARTMHATLLVLLMLLFTRILEKFLIKNLQQHTDLQIYEARVK